MRRHMELPKETNMMILNQLEHMRTNIKRSAETMPLKSFVIMKQQYAAAGYVLVKVEGNSRIGGASRAELVVDSEEGVIFGLIDGGLKRRALCTPNFISLHNITRNQRQNFNPLLLGITTWGNTGANGLKAVIKIVDIECDVEKVTKPVETEKMEGECDDKVVGKYIVDGGEGTGASGEKGNMGLSEMLIKGVFVNDEVADEARKEKTNGREVGVWSKFNYAVSYQPNWSLTNHSRLSEGGVPEEFSRHAFPRIRIGDVSSVG
ncbi:hypothetical protein L1887_27774 [Cichorium endivia]|nr:hypothetical protein L1887_27774 [Cichorium endivia]